MLAGNGKQKTHTAGAARLVHAAKKTRSLTVTKSIRSLLVLAAAVSMTSAVAFADSGEAIYKANCVTCHGATGTPSAGMAKMMSIKAASDPAMKALSVADMTASVKNGKGKSMKAFGGKLTDAQIKDVVTYFRSLK